MNSEQKRQLDTKGVKFVIGIEGFRKLWIAQLFSQLADKFLIILTIFIISENWASSAPFNIESPGQIITLLASGVYLANSLPAILFGAIAGIFSDIFPRLKLMILSNLSRAILASLIPICLIKGSTWKGLDWGYWYLLIIIFLLSCFTQLFTPAEQSSIPLLVKKNNLLEANSIYQATTMGATIFGFALGDPLLRIMRLTFHTLGINGGQYFLLPICYGISAIVLTEIILKESVKNKYQGSIIEEIKSALFLLKEQSIVRRSIIQLVILYSLMTSLYIVAIGLASEIPELGPTRFGILLSFSGIGIATGAFFIAQRSHFFREHKLSTIGMSLIGLSLILLGQVKGTLIATIILCTFIGTGASFVAIPAQTKVQQHTPEKKLGKVLGIQNNLINIALSFPLLLVGGLVAKLGLLPLLWILAGIALFSALFEKSL
ncbi:MULTISPECIES: MFS transporter [Prochlorococcus]|uniref:MFS transporter n=1 Tax=Prochlorococcus TaxID=1218 RepID=UPI000533AB4E|nr:MULTISPECIES: MFS transporter [Prochlorococcus]KGG13002.1 Multidrug efflux transporter [Prochlorococcus sp. MIT 0601]